ncbi:MAG: hypothetical protein ABI459_00910 [Deltaproteobacteria bacterium]
MKFTTLLATTAILFATTAQAAEITEAQFTYENWTGTAYTDDQTGGFLYCSVYTTDANDRVFELDAEKDGTFSFYLSNPAVKRNKGDKYEVTMMTNLGGTIVANFSALDDKFVYATFTDTTNVVAWLTDATSYRVLGLDDDEAYLTPFINQAMARVLACTAERIGALGTQPAPQNAPATSGGPKLPPPRKP